MWPEKDIPEDYLELAKKLIRQGYVSEVEFVELCNLAVKHIDSGSIPIEIRSDMALYIANLWLCHNNIGDATPLDDIGGQFADWDIPGSLSVEDDLGKRYWERLKHWVDIANDKFPGKYQ
jgi:hypothetical protein